MATASREVRCQHQNTVLVAAWREDSNGAGAAAQFLQLLVPQGTCLTLGLQCLCFSRCFHKINRFSTNLPEPLTSPWYQLSGQDYARGQTRQI